MKQKAVKNLVAVAYTLAVTFAVGKWTIYAACLERGYEAVGGEYCLMLMACWTAWKSINYLFGTLEDFENERSSKEGRCGKTSRMRDNR